MPQRLSVVDARPASGWRRRIHQALDPARCAAGLSPSNTVLVAAIVLACGLAIIETETSLLPTFGGLFVGIEKGLGLLFGAEYGLRVWTAPERDSGAEAWRERLRFLVSPAGLADLLAILASVAFVSGSSALLLRLVRLGRILRLAKLGRMSRAFTHIVEAIASRRDELILSLTAGMSLMVLAATALYFAEGTVQPEKFGSIPRALWWSVATLTTIGYGDVYPITPVGKVLAAVTAILSIGLVAMPTGILAAAFSESVQRHRRSPDEV